MNSNFVIYNKKINIKEKSQKFRISPLASVILCNRDIYDDEDISKMLSSNIDDLNESRLLPDVDIAANVLHEYVVNKKKIRIIGDYDVDGVCATYILYDALKKLGANVSYYLPNRFQDGYGININIIDNAIKDKIDLIITCDNGIAAKNEIKYAKDNGVDVIVTDHHDISDLPSEASAIVNPKRNDVKNIYPFDGICGATVALKFMDRYYEIFEGKKGFIVDYYLDFVTIATVSDIMPLVNENHIIVKLGLDRVKNTKNKGLKKLLEKTGVDFDTKGVSVYSIGFLIGPLINAAGRMEDANLALKLFILDGEEEINQIASTLKHLNEERKNLTENGTKAAIKIVEEKYSDNKVLVIYVEDLGEQVAGIVAGRIKDMYNKPTIILTNTVDDEVAKASCRSIEAYNMYDSLNKHIDMLIKFGGHKMAAGFSISKNNIDRLRDLLNEESGLSENDLARKVYIDAEFPFYSMNEELIAEIERFAPYGQKFTRPIFATRMVKTEIVNVYGDNQNVIKLSLEKDGEKAGGIIFEESNLIKDRLNVNNLIDIVYYPKINEYKGHRKVEINLVNYR